MTPRAALLAAVARRAAVVVTVPSPLPEGDTVAAFVVPRPGRYEVWLGGSFVRRLTATVDGVRTGSSHEQLNEAGELDSAGDGRASGPARTG